jgi:serine/threonine protein kinase
VSEHPPIPGYELLELRGRNGHLIYLARQSSSGRLVHLNVVHSAGNFGRMVAEGLRQQATLLAALDHPNVLRLVQVGEAQDYGFFSALEYAAGGCLADKIRSGPVSPSEAVSLARAIASALQSAREQCAVAYDLTPGSVLLTEDGLAKLADFRPSGASGADALRAKVLTPGYAAPEEVSDPEGVEPLPSLDVYRIGAVLYGMLTGEPPFGRSRDLIGTLRQVVEQAPAAVRQRNAAVPAELEAVCMKCLEKSPVLRYAQPSDLVVVFDQLPALSRNRASQPGTPAI